MNHCSRPWRPSQSGLPRARGDEPWEEAGWNRTSTRGVRTERSDGSTTHLFAVVYRPNQATVYILMHNFRPDWTGRIQPCLDVWTCNRSVNPVWTWERANRTLALSTASTGRMSCAGRAPDRIGSPCDDACPTAGTPDTALTERLPGPLDVWTDDSARTTCRRLRP